MNGREWVIPPSAAWLVLTGGGSLMVQFANVGSCLKPPFSEPAVNDCFVPSADLFVRDRERA